MNSLAPPFAFLAGLFLGLLWLSFATRWLRLLFGFGLSKRNLDKVPGSRSLTQYMWVLTLLVVNPAPWLLIITPFVAYRILANPHLPQWEWFFFGILTGPAVLAYSMVTAFDRYKKSSER